MASSGSPTVGAINSLASDSNSSGASRHAWAPAAASVSSVARRILPIALFRRGSRKARQAHRDEDEAISARERRIPRMQCPPAGVDEKLFPPLRNRFVKLDRLPARSALYPATSSCNCSSPG